MESFEEIARRARKELDAQHRAADDAAQAEQERADQLAENLRQATELRPIVMHEASVVAQAMHGKVPTYRAVPQDVLRLSRKLLPEPGLHGGAPAQWRVRRGERRMNEERLRASFPVWDLGVKYKYSEPQNPDYTFRQHFFLGSSGTVVYTDYFTPENYEASGSFVGTQNMRWESAELVPLNLLRTGLAKLAITHNLDVEL